MIAVTGQRAKHFQAANATNLQYSEGLTGVLPKDGDWMLAIISGQSAYSGSMQPLLPSGWSWLILPFTPGSGTTYFALAGKQFKTGDPQSATFSANVNGSTNGYNLTLLWGTGADTPLNWPVGTKWVRNGGSTLLMRSPSITTTKAGSTVLAWAGERTINAETDAQVTVDNMPEWLALPHGDQYINVAAQEFPNAGTVTQEVVTRVPNGHAQNGYGFQMEAIPAPFVEPPAPTPSGLKTRIYTEDGYVEGYVKVKTETGFATPGAVKVIRRGYEGVDQMLSQFFYVAHRGGSREHPEMSRYGYVQSALIGYGALELSLARTIDGVWFGLHDDSIDRTSGVVTGKIASQMTWDEVQQYQILGSMASNRPSQPNRPYMRWEELMDLYYDSHVFLVDPKASMAFRVELMNMMDAMPGEPTQRFVGKFYGKVGTRVPNGQSFPEQMTARGYKSWGYFYEVDMADMPDYQGRWEILGMDYNASQEAWDLVKSFGKPVIGHITPTRVAADMAIAKGANGLMVSGVRSVEPLRV